MSAVAEVFVESVLFPAEVTASIFFGFDRFTRGRGRTIIAALALAIAYAAADIASRGFIGWWPTDPTRRLPWWAVLVLAVTLWEAGVAWIRAGRLRPALIYGARTAACLLAAWLLIRVVRERSELSSVWWNAMLALLALFFVGQWRLLDVAAHGDGPWPSLFLAVLAGLSGAVVALSGWMGVAQALFALGICLATIAPVSWSRREVLPMAGVVGAFVLLYQALIGCACWFGQLPGLAAAMLAVAPIFACPRLVAWLAPRLTERRVIQAIGLLAVVFIAATLVHRDAPGEMPHDDLFSAGGYRDYCYVSVFEDQRLAIYRIDASSGKLSAVGSMPMAGKPRALATDPKGRFLFASTYSPDQLTSFRIDAQTGGLTQIGTIAAGAEPTHISTDREGRFLLCACYEAGTISVHAIGPDGRLSPKPRQTIATAPMVHSVVLDPENQVAFAPHTGPEAIFQFRYDAASGGMEPAPVPKISTKNAGPRHIVFHPCKDTAYVVNEGGGSVTAYRLDREAATLCPFQTMSTLPPGYKAFHACAEIRIDASGRFLFASTRGLDSIACYQISPTDRRLTLIEHVPTERMPRSFDLSPDGRFLYVASETWGRLAAYRIDATRGNLTRLSIHELGLRPLWVQTVRLPSR